MILWHGQTRMEEEPNPMKVKIVVNTGGLSGRILAWLARRIETTLEDRYLRDLSDRINYGMPSAVREHVTKPDYELVIGAPRPDTKRGFLHLEAPK